MKARPAPDPRPLLGLAEAYSAEASHWEGKWAEAEERIAVLESCIRSLRDHYHKDGQEDLHEVCLGLWSSATPDDGQSPFQPPD